MSGLGKMGNYVYESLKDEFEFSDNGDILIDFTNGRVCRDIIIDALKNGKKVISGTTNMENEDILAIKKASIMYEESLIWVPNFSCGAIVLSEILKHLKVFFDKIEIIETHNISKVDAPSGTALEYSEILECDNIRSKRLETNKAIHEINFYNQGERLGIVHELNGRDAFLVGIKKALEIIMEREYILSIGLDDFLDLLKSEY